MRLLGIRDVAKWTKTPFATVRDEWIGSGRDDLQAFEKPTGAKVVTKINLRALWKYLDPKKASWENYEEIEEDYDAWKKQDNARARELREARSAAKEGVEVAK